MKTLYVTDMDGTLLNASSRVSKRSSQIINRLTEAGALITVATARTPATVVPLLSGLRLSLPAIVMTGAALWDWNACSYVAPCYIKRNIAADIMRLSRMAGVNMFRYTIGADGVLDVYHCGDMSEKEQAFVNERSDLRFKRFHIGGGCADGDNTALFFAIGDRNRIFRLADDLRLTVDCSVSAYVDIFGEDTGIIEVFAPHVSKAEAVKSMAREVGAERIVVFGDNLNDIPMMQVADVPVAVSNALEEVKQVSVAVIGSNEDDAVARFMRDDFYGRQRHG